MISLLSALNMISNANSAVGQNILFFSLNSLDFQFGFERTRPDDRWALLGEARLKITETKNIFDA